MKRIIYCNPDYDCRINWLIKELDLVEGSPTTFFAGSRKTYKDLCRKCVERDVVPPLLITDDDDLVGKNTYILLTDDYYNNRDFVPEHFGIAENATWFITILDDNYLRESYYRLNRNVD